ncbi:MAG: TIGR04255 family protein [Sphingomonas sp.]|nr:TIGR04255 family protein [Sphingomonas sp.]
MKPIHPKFGNPPLFEQAIAVVFDAIPTFSLGDFGKFWSRIDDEFDTCEARPIVDPRFEAFDQPPHLGFEMRLVPAESLPRCFYRHKDKSELVQLQADRFGFNWLKRAERKYPHFELTVSRFFDLYDKFDAFCSERGFATPAVRQCEITNVNIVPVANAGEVDRARETFAHLPELSTHSFLSPETISYSTQHQIMSEDGRPVGRLYQIFSPAVLTDTNERAYRLELTARGAPQGEGSAGVKSFFELARTAINGAFLAATTEAAQRTWGYIDGNRV